MKPSFSARLGGILLLASLLASAQQAKPGMLSAEELKKVVPSAYFFRGQSGAVQLRNSAGFRAQDGKLVLAGFVDTSGYAADLPVRVRFYKRWQVRGHGCWGQRSARRFFQARRRSKAPGAAQDSGRWGWL